MNRHSRQCWMLVLGLAACAGPEGLDERETAEAAIEALPDLVVSSLGYANGVFTCEVVNQGTVATPAGKKIPVGYLVDGVERTWSDQLDARLAPGAKLVLGTKGPAFMIPTGVHTISAYVNDTAQFPEASTTNNVLTKTITLGETKPDLVVQSFQYLDGIFTAVVKNLGGATPAGITIPIAYQVDGVEKTWGHVVGVMLGAGQTLTIGSTGGAYQVPAGTHTLTAWVDDTNRVVESNDANNTLSKVVTIGAPTGGNPVNVTFAPPSLPFSAAELPNPFRGQYLWHDKAPVPLGWPTVDSYYRFNWIDLSPARHVYNWALIDQRLAKAKAMHGRFGMRVMALCQDCSPHTFNGARSAIPDDLAAVSNPTVVRDPANGAAYLVPDWNSEAYLSRLEELLSAIAARYGNDAAFAFFDLSGFGNWGEMHLYPFGGATLSAANATRLVAMHTRLFPTKTLLSLTAHPDVLAAAVASTAKPIGLRIDCLGSDRMGGAEGNLARTPGADKVWRRAPVMTEWCQYNLGNSGLNMFVLGEQQMRTFHVSTLGTNFRVSPSTTVEQTAYRQADVGSGYRLRTSSVKVAITAAAPTTLQVESTWVNDGVAPNYLEWKAMLIVDGPSAKVTLPLSSLDLRQVFPGAPLTHAQTSSLPSALPVGTYKVFLRLDDAQGISPPMFLAQDGRGTDGTYLLGTFTR